MTVVYRCIDGKDFASIQEAIEHEKAEYKRLCDERVKSKNRLKYLYPKWVEARKLMRGIHTVRFSEFVTFHNTDKMLEIIKKYREASALYLSEIDRLKKIREYSKEFLFVAKKNKKGLK